ncbi:Thioredoxin [Popillia japonica]|uniref:Protein disulfide-isomerase n=1 Tax=Popillia japonica TaxID=7064 RepID=A0AAW1JFW2_POPJA
MLPSIILLFLFHSSLLPSVRSDSTLPFEYTDANFKNEIINHQTALVMFYAPWCGHCQKLKPEFEKAAKELADNDPPVTLIKVDCTAAGKSTCSEHEVDGYPLLKIFRNGEAGQTYSNARKAEDIINYMKLQVGKSYTEFVDAIEMEESIKMEKNVLIFGFFEEDSSEMKKAFMEIADKLRDKMKFACTSSKDVLEKYGETDNIMLVRPAHLRNNFEDDQVKYGGKPNFHAIDTFIRKNYHGLVGIRNEDNEEEFDTPLITAYYNVDYKMNPKNTNYWRNRILKVAQQYKQSKLTFAITKFEYLKEFGEIKHKNSPIIVAKNEKNQKFMMEEEFSVENFDRFINKFLKNELQPFIKSEDIPETNDGPVKIAVAKNFDDVIVNNGKDTLIVLYSPWCGHCQRMMPTYAKLAEKLQDDDVVIAKMDATANDVPEAFEVKGYPTIYFATKDKKNEPISYEGGRSLQDFIKFIAEHASEELKDYDRKGNEKKDEL